MPLLPGIPTLPSLTENQPTGLPGPPAGRTSLPNPLQYPKRATRRPSPLVTRAGLHHSRTKVRLQNRNELTGGRENRKGRGYESSPEPVSGVAARPACPQYGARKSRRAWHRGGARMLAIGTAPRLGRDSAPYRWLSWFGWLRVQVSEYLLHPWRTWGTELQAEVSQGLKVHLPPVIRNSG